MKINYNDPEQCNYYGLSQETVKTLKDFGLELFYDDDNNTLCKFRVYGKVGFERYCYDSDELNWYLNWLSITYDSEFSSTIFPDNYYGQFYGVRTFVNWINSILKTPAGDNMIKEYLKEMVFQHENDMSPRIEISGSYTKSGNPECFIYSVDKSDFHKTIYILNRGGS